MWHFFYFLFYLFFIYLFIFFFFPTFTVCVGRPLYFCYVCWTVIQVCMWAVTVGTDSYFLIFIRQRYLTLTLLTWRIWWAPNNASRWQMGFNSVFKGLIKHLPFSLSLSLSPLSLSPSPSLPPPHKLNLIIFSHIMSRLKCSASVTCRGKDPDCSVS